MKNKQILYLAFFCILFLGFTSDKTCSTGIQDDKLSVFNGLPIPKDENMMFYIQKNVNPNTIVYALKIGSDGKINTKDPMEVFWRRYQEDGRKKKLGWLEKTFAFDFNVKPVKGKENTYVFSLVALKKKQIYVTQNKSGKPKTVTLINGKTSQLERVYLMVDDSKTIHDVLSIELFGKDLKTGDFTYEIIKKK